MDKMTKKKTAHKKSRGRPPSEGKTSKQLDEVKDKNNLMKHKEMQILERDGLVEQVEKKINRLERFAAANERLINTMHSAGWDITNVFHNYVDLQDKIFELEQQLLSEGKNPLESAEWMKAREQLNKELQFIHKHKLEFEKFEFTKNTSKAGKKDEDELFKVE